MKVPACTREELEGTVSGTPSGISESGYITSNKSSYSGSGLASGGSSKSKTKLRKFEEKLVRQQWLRRQQR